MFDIESEVTVCFLNFLLSGITASEYYLQSTFVLDYEEVDVKAVVDALLEQHKTKPSLNDTTRFVDHWIHTKNNQRGFDIASQVARSHTGDCTEHAVLLGSINRALEFPTKVILGIVIIGSENRLTAFGHAWTEVYHQGQWQLQDAALAGLQDPAFYIPTGTLDNEGPGYALSLMQTLLRFPNQIVLQ